MTGFGTAGDRAALRAVADIPEAGAGEVRGEPEPGAGERMLRLAFGVASLVVGSIIDAGQQSFRASERQPAEPVRGEGSAQPGGFALALGAAFGVTMSVARTATLAGAAIESRLRPLVPASVDSLYREMADDARSRLQRLDEPWRTQRPAVEATAREFVDELVPRLVAAALDRLDLTELLLRIDIDRVVESIDVQAIIDRVDIDALAARVDLNAALQRVDMVGLVKRLDEQGVFEQLNLNPVVDRLDLDRIASRIDIEAIVERIDIVGIAGTVIEEIDLAGIIRQSTGTMADEAVEGVRAQGMNADRLLSRLIDRSLKRQTDRDTAVPNDSGRSANEP